MKYFQCLEDKCTILNATVAQRSKFIDLIEKEPNLQVMMTFIFFFETN